jgi:Tol biopolymer transport system component
LSRQIISINRQTHAMTGITNPLVGMPGDEQPTLSSSGTRLAFVRTRAPGVADLLLLENGSHDIARLTTDNIGVNGLAWDGAGYSLVFSSARGGRSALWRIRIKDTTPELLLSTAGDLRSPAISPNGRLLAYEEWSTVTRLDSVPLVKDGSDATFALDDSSLARQPQLAPQRDRYVYVSNKTGNDELWLVPVAGGSPKMLTGAKFQYIEYPHWSPDGQTIIFGASQAGKFDLWVTHVADGRVSQLTHDGGSRTPIFSHDGHWIYFSRNGANGWQLWRSSWPDGPQAAVTMDGGLAPVESDDGNSLLYARPDRRGIWQKSATPGGTPTLVAADFSPRDWSNFLVMGNTLVYASRSDSGETRLNRRLIDSGEDKGGIALQSLYEHSGLTMAPDGKSIIATFEVATHADLKVATLQ